MNNKTLIVDTIWCRLLCTLERLEIAEGIFTERTTLCHDLKSGHEPTADDRIDLIDEHQLQKKAFFVAVAPISSEIPRYFSDFCAWCAPLPCDQSNLINNLCRKLGLELIGQNSSDAISGDSFKDSGESGPVDLGDFVVGGNIGVVSSASDHSHIRGPIQSGISYLVELDKAFASLQEEDGSPVKEIPYDPNS